MIEMLVTLAILAALAMVAAPLVQVAAQRQKEDELRRALWSIRDAIDAYKKAGDEGKFDRSLGDTGYPPKLETLVEGVVDKTDPKHARIYFLRRILRDPLCDCPSRSDDATWGKRSYASEPDSPNEGDDVYDVYSLSEGTTLKKDGFSDSDASFATKTSYSDWQFAYYPEKSLRRP
ncbi:putative secretion system X protein GspG-like protein [Candidatus Burkholderia verschuerenii]|uniref:Putative secretion system X protein GspG-like protein n=2 Tax=Candidatus Burkholderia verschuerenii TaxID=242163 RepID=A0A0L0MB64_9BURK|nr:putative secretion system X protein GspG-like protein [Candidatus Burkholderia verschuerenii]